MATVGLRHCVVRKVSTSQSNSMFSNPAYTGQGMRIGNIRSAEISWNSSNTKLHGDDRLVLMDNSATSGTIKIETTYIPTAALYYMLGYKQGTSGDNKIYRTDEPTKKVGMGFVVERVDETGAKTYWAYWYRLVQFSMNSQNARTREENTAYGTPTIEGEIFRTNGSGSSDLGFGYVRKYTDEDSAISHLETMANISGTGIDDIEVEPVNPGQGGEEPVVEVEDP